MIVTATFIWNKPPNLLEGGLFLALTFSGCSLRELRIVEGGWTLMHIAVVTGHVVTSTSRRRPSLRIQVYPRLLFVAKSEICYLRQFCTHILLTLEPPCTSADKNAFWESFLSSKGVASQDG